MATSVYSRRKPSRPIPLVPQSSLDNEFEVVASTRDLSQLLGLGQSDVPQSWQQHIVTMGRGTARASKEPAKLPNDKSATQLQQRLDNANRHFKRKAAEVFSDADAIRLLAKLYKSINLDIDDFDSCQQGIALSKLTAANFCEIGAKVIYITEAGQKFIEALNSE